MHILQFISQCGAMDIPSYHPDDKTTPNIHSIKEPPPRGAPQSTTAASSAVLNVPYRTHSVVLHSVVRTETAKRARVRER